MATHLTTIYYAAGHSGGHIIPLISLAQEKKQEDPATQIVMITSSKELDRAIVGKSRAIHYTLPIGQQRHWYAVPLLAAALIYSFFKSCALMLFNRPAKIVTTGSIIAMPVCLAGWILRIPIELWEVNATPGKTIQFLSRYATTIHVCFAQTKNYFKTSTVILSPYPIRQELKKPSMPFEGPAFSPDRLTLFILGGSQGSQGINRLIKQTIIDYPDLVTKIQIMHQAGPQAPELEAFYKKQGIPARVFAYDHDIAQYYRAADLVICRSGAGSLFETIYFSKKCLTIPLEGAAGSHQLDNALAAQQEHAALITVIRQGLHAPAQIYAHLTAQSHSVILK